MCSMGEESSTVNDRRKIEQSCHVTRPLPITFIILLLDLYGAWWALQNMCLMHSYVTFHIICPM